MFIQPELIRGRGGEREGNDRSFYSAQEGHQQDTESSSGGEKKIPGGLVKVVFIPVDGMIHRLLEKTAAEKHQNKYNLFFLLLYISALLLNL